MKRYFYKLNESGADDVILEADNKPPYFYNKLMMFTILYSEIGKKHGYFKGNAIVRNRNEVRYATNREEIMLTIL